MSASRLWANQDAFAGDLAELAAINGIPLALAYALVAQESGFNPQAHRDEPGIGDASFGLTQILLGTARGEGYDGDGPGLYDPRVNLLLGLGYLRKQIARAGDIPGGLSAYNGGWRPSSGFGRPRADGKFANQAYVDGVTQKAAYFASYLAAQPMSAGMPVWLGLALLGAALFKKHR